MQTAVSRPGITAVCIQTATVGDERNAFFSIPASIIRRRAQLPPPAAGQPGPLSLGDPGVIEDLFRRARSVAHHLGRRGYGTSSDRQQDLLASPDAGATFHLEHTADGEPLLVWRRIGDHSIYQRP